MAIIQNSQRPTALPVLPAPELVTDVSEPLFPAVDYVRASIAREIIQGRQALGLNQKELAKRAGIRVETLCRIETGKHTASVPTIDRIERALREATPRNAPEKQEPKMPAKKDRGEFVIEQLAAYFYEAARSADCTQVFRQVIKDACDETRYVYPRTEDFDQDGKDSDDPEILASFKASWDECERQGQEREAELKRLGITEIQAVIRMIPGADRRRRVLTICIDQEKARILTKDQGLRKPIRFRIAGKSFKAKLRSDQSTDSIIMHSDLEDKTGVISDLSEVLLSRGLKANLKVILQIKGRGITLLL